MANTYLSIASVTVGSGGASSIEFTSIPATYTDLVVKVSARGAANFNPRNFYLNLNSDTGNNYPFRFLYGNGSAASFSNSTNEGFTSTAWIGYIPGNTSTASTFSNIEIYIPNYTSSSYKYINGSSVTENNAATAFASIHTSAWNNNSTINSIRFTCSNSENFAEYSTATLYGIKNT